MRKRRQRRRPDVVVIQTRGGSVEPGGGRSGDWEDGDTVSAEIERMQSFRFDVERMIAGVNTSAPIVRIHVDNTATTRAVSSHHRLKDGRTGVIYNINTKQDLDGDGRSFVILCSENVPS